MGVPAVNIGSRQSGRLRGSNVVDVDYNSDEIRNAIFLQMKNKSLGEEKIYGDGKSGKRIAEVLYKTELTVYKKLTY